MVQITIKFLKQVFFIKEFRLVWCKREVPSTSLLSFRLERQEFQFPTVILSGNTGIPVPRRLSLKLNKDSLTCPIYRLIEGLGALPNDSRLVGPPAEGNFSTVCGTLG